MSLSRIPLGLALWWRPLDIPWLLGVMAVAALSDVLDGRMARRRDASVGSHTAGGSFDHLGAVLDPICDKLFVASLIALVWSVRHPPAWTLLLIAVRDLAVIGLTAMHRLVPRFRDQPATYKARPAGKAATAAQFLALGVLLFRPEWFVPFAWLTGVIGLVAGLDYWRHTPDRSWRPPPRGAERAQAPLVGDIPHR
jgi:phosphatidylglycerophosphate synthase